MADFGTENLCRCTTTKVGNGTVYTIGPAVAGNQSILNMDEGAVDVFMCRKLTANQWECFVGTVNRAMGRVTRTQMLSSSTGGGAIVWAAGSKDIYSAITVERKVVGDGIHSVFNDNATTGNRVLTSYDMTHQQVIGRIGF